MHRDKFFAFVSMYFLIFAKAIAIRNLYTCIHCPCILAEGHQAPWSLPDFTIFSLPSLGARYVLNSEEAVMSESSMDPSSNPRGELHCP